MSVSGYLGSGEMNGWTIRLTIGPTRGNAFSSLCSLSSDSNCSEVTPWGGITCIFASASGVGLAGRSTSNPSLPRAFWMFSRQFTGSYIVKVSVGHRVATTQKKTHRRTLIARG